MTTTPRANSHGRMLGLHRRSGLAVLLLAIFVLAGCSQSIDPPAVTSTTGAPSGDLKIPADFQITVYRGQDTLGGEELAFSSLFTQGKPVVLNFWAGLCPPCRAEMPDFQSVSVEYQDRVILFGLDIGPFVGLGSRDNGRALVRELDVTYPTGTTFDGQAISGYRVLGMPTTVFMTPDGEVQRTWTGPLTKRKLLELMGDLLEASAG
ncbi:MAG: TlpA disulfide reductase family protein [Dehalococcoidia bacterium]